MKIFSCLLVFLLVFAGFAPAAEKNWSGSGDGASWSDDDNWYAAVEPSSVDDVLIDINDATVICSETFLAKSITIAGREDVTLTANNFVFGTVSPDEASDVAILNRSGGKFTLTGAGVVTLQGQYKDSEESLVAEPNFMFWIE